MISVLRFKGMGNGKSLGSIVLKFETDLNLTP